MTTNRLNAHETLLINILNNMYNDNLRQIVALRRNNDEIRQEIINFVNSQHLSNNNRNTNDHLNANNDTNNNDNNNTVTRGENIQNTLYSNIESNDSNNTSRATINNNFFDTLNRYGLSNFSPINRIRRTNNDDSTIDSIDNSMLRNQRRRYDSTNVTRSSVGNELNSSIDSLYNIFINYYTEEDSILTTGASQEEIDRATRSTRFGNIINPQNASCYITLETFTDDDNVVMIRHCNHIFKPECINIWLLRNSLCPVCRYDIKTYIMNVNLYDDEDDDQDDDEDNDYDNNNDE